MTDLQDVTRTRHYGKHRALVVNNVDPQQMGRIQVMVPDVSPGLSSWAMPCVPMAGMGHGVFTLPTIGAAVWVEFEQGDPDYPIWVGCYWGSGAEVPVMSHSIPPGVNGLTIQTQLGNTLQISDTPGPTGGILIKTTTGAMISVSDIGITISNGKGAVISMMGPTTDINAGGLTVI
jgi:uncharacterized protein involved in type VI secretion and phage assembly